MITERDEAVALPYNQGYEDDDALLIAAMHNAMPALLAVAEAAQEVLRCEDDITEPDYVLGRATESLRAALSLLPNVVSPPTKPGNNTQEGSVISTLEKEDYKP